MVATGGRMKFRILILSKDLYAEGGVANFVRMLMACSKENIEWDHFSIGNRDGSAGIFPGSCLAIRDSFLLTRRVNRELYDCIHINPSLNARSLLRDGLFLFVLSISRYKNIIVFFHGWEDETETRLNKNKIFRSLFKKSLSLVSIILVLGERFKKSLTDMGVPQEKIRFMTNFFDGSIFNGVKRQAKSNGKSILFLSRFAKEKGVFETLEAFNLLSSEFPDAKLVFAGDGPEKRSMKKKVEEYGIESRVEFVGYVRGASKAQVLLDSDIFILPTYGEGCPVALLEAMAAGLPIITCPVGGISDIFVDGENGIFLPKLSPSDIAYSIRYLLQNPSLRSSISENNRQYAWENFEVNLVTRKLEKIYAEVVSQNIRV